MRNARAAIIGFIILLTLSIVSSIGDMIVMRAVNQAEEQARQQAFALVEVERLRFLMEKKASSSRAYLLTREDRFLNEIEAQHAAFLALVGRIRDMAMTPEGEDILAEIVEVEDEHQQVLSRIADTTANTRYANVQVFLQRVQPIRDNLDLLLNELAERKLERVQQENTRAERFSARAMQFVIILSVLLLLGGIALATYLGRAIREREKMEQGMFKETVEQNLETQTAIRELRAERDAANQRITELLTKHGKA